VCHSGSRSVMRGGAIPRQCGGQRPGERGSCSTRN
jgi:hypothetical protein